MKRVALGAALAALLGVVAFSSPSVAADPPQFQVDPFWPKPLPNNWLFGQIGGLAVDANDHVWVLQRPRSLTEDERGATLKPPRSNCWRRVSNSISKYFSICKATIAQLY